MKVTQELIGGEIWKCEWGQMPLHVKSRNYPALKHCMWKHI